MLFDTRGRPGWADPMRELQRMQDEVNRVFGGYRTGVSGEFPPVNLWTGEQGAVLTAELPGIGADDLAITVHEDTVTLKGKRAAAVSDEEATYHRRERSYGSFARSVALPFAVASDQVQARIEDGILTLMLPRHEAERPKRIKINKG